MSKRRILNITEAKARFSALVKRANHGEEIIIARNGQPQARLVALPASRPRLSGKGTGKWNVADDFNDSLPAELTHSIAD